MKLDKLKLHQRGRSQVDFIINISQGSQSVKNKSLMEIESLVNQMVLPDDFDLSNDIIEDLAKDLAAFQVKELVSEWHSRYHGVIAMEAFDEIGKPIEVELDNLNEGSAILEVEDEFQVPDYWDGVEFHRTSGGWDGHPYMGCVHGEIVHRRIVEGIFPGSIFEQRRKVANMAPKDNYPVILDMGCSTGHFTEALSEIYPDAQVIGVDISLKCLEHARRVANANKWSWKLLRRAAEDTGLPADSIDLVSSYILLHEIPEKTIVEIFEEAFRVLRPGGDIVFSDVPRLYDLSKVDAWNVERSARLGGEPHWRSAGFVDLKKAAEAAGFSDVIVQGGYPYVIQGRKPQ